MFSAELGCHDSATDFMNSRSITYELAGYVIEKDWVPGHEVNHVGILPVILD